MILRLFFDFEVNMKKTLLIALVTILSSTSFAVFADSYSAEANRMAQEYLEHKRTMELLERAKEQAKIKQQINREYKKCIKTGVAVEECDALIASMNAIVSPGQAPQRPLQGGGYFNRIDEKKKSQSDSGEDSASMQLLKKLQDDVDDMRTKKARASAPAAKKTSRANARVPKMLRVVNGKVVFKTSEGETSARVGDTLPGGFVLRSFSLTRAILSLDGSKYETEISW